MALIERSRGSYSGNTPPRCLLKVDGILADFVRSAAEAHKRPIPESWPKPEAGKSPAFAAAFGMMEVDFWAIATEGFWNELYLTRDSIEIVQVVERWFGSESVSLLIEPPPRPYTVAGRLRWVLNYWPSYQKRFVITPDPVQLAHPRLVLITDDEAQYTAWRAAGGVSVIYPRPWNSRGGIREGTQFLNSVLYAVLDTPACKIFPLYEEGIPL